MFATAPIRARAALLLFALVMLMPWGRVWAGCSYNGSGANVNFSMPTTITVPYDAPVGAVLYTSSQVSPSQSLNITCSGTTNYGVSNVVGATPGVGTAIYPTGIAGVGYRLLHGTSDPSDYMYPYPCCRLAAGSYNFTVTTAVQLIKTGTIADGARLPNGTFARWLYDRSSGGGTVSTQNYIFGNAVTFISPACQVTTTNIAVALPPVNTTSLPAPDATAGATSFRIGMNCRSGATLNIMFETNSPVSGKPGVISQPTGGGRARGVGVQLVNASYQPVDFGTETAVGATPQGTLDLTYYARYYRTGATTGNNFSAGTVSATATFTLSYD